MIEMKIQEKMIYFEIVDRNLTPVQLIERRIEEIKRVELKIKMMN